MHLADARSSAAHCDVVPLSQVTLARGLEDDPPVVLEMSSLVGLRRCTLASIATQAASGAASTCAQPDSCVDIFSPVRRRFSSATGKSDVTEYGHRRLGGSTLRLSTRTRGYNHQWTVRSTGGVCRGSCLRPFLSVCGSRMHHGRGGMWSSWVRAHAGICDFNIFILSQSTHPRKRTKKMDVRVARGPLGSTAAASTRHICHLKIDKQKGKPPLVALHHQFVRES